MNKDRKEQMMLLAKGDVNEYNEIRKLSAEDYCIKFENFLKSLPK